MQPPHVLFRMVFVGDITMTSTVGRNVARQARGLPVDVAAGYPFGGVSKHFAAADLLVGNLECVASPLGRHATPDHPLRCPVLALDALKQAGFDVLGVANNHALDYGHDAFRDQLTNIEASGLAHVGAASVEYQPQRATIWEHDGQRVGMLAYYHPPQAPFSDVHAARAEVDWLVIYNHWGREDQVEPMPQQRELAHGLIDAGADLVVGTHAHVVQPTEWYQGKLIAYGLGNFMFDAAPLTAARRHGALLEVDALSDHSVDFRMLDIRIDDDFAPIVVANAKSRYR